MPHTLIFFIEMESRLIGVDNRAVGAAAAAQLIWLVVFLQKWRAFRRPKNIISNNNNKLNSTQIVYCVHKGHTG